MHSDYLSPTRRYAGTLEHVHRATSFVAYLVITYHQQPVMPPLVVSQSLPPQRQAVVETTGGHSLQRFDPITRAANESRLSWIGWKAWIHLAAWSDFDSDHLDRAFRLLPETDTGKGALVKNVSGDCFWLSLRHYFSLRLRQGPRGTPDKVETVTETFKYLSKIGSI